MSSADLRNYVINTITNALLFPESYGDRFFVQLVSTAERGYIPLTLVHGMVKDLQDVPLKYIEHCADREPHRLQLSIDRTKIRITRQYSEDPVDDPERETDAYGTTQQQQQQQQQQEEEEQEQQEQQQQKQEKKEKQNQDNHDREQHERGEKDYEKNITSTTSTPSSSYLSTTDNIKPQKDDQKAKQQPVKHFQHYKPFFVTKQSITAPVYFNNGKFYNDEEEISKKVRQDRPRMEVPPYEKLDISALGDPRNTENLNVCWNCGSEDHSYGACPEPRDEAMINEYRKRIKKPNGPANTGRFFVELAIRNKIATLRPGKVSLNLQKALGMNSQYPEPPYYTKMRQFGYPPGYWKSPKERDHLLSQWKNPEAWSEELLYEDTGNLKIFTDTESYEKNNTDSQDGPVKRIGTNERVKLVHYPGLETWGDLDSRKQKTTTEPHLEFSYAPSYHFAHPSIAPKTSTNGLIDSTTTITNVILPTNSKIEYPTMRQQSSQLTPVSFEQYQQQQYQQQQQYSAYYQYDYYSYPQYNYPYQTQPQQPEQYSQQEQVQQSNVPQNTNLATPVSFTSNKGELEDGEIDMDISDDND